MTGVRAFVVGKVDEAWGRRVVELPDDQLGDGELLVQVECSGINYKDGLAGSEKGRVARIDPLVPGIDLAGLVLESSDPAFPAGSRVIAHGYDIGVAHHGGYAAKARVKSEWAVAMPAGLDSRTAMLVGTAGYTAAMSVAALEGAGLAPGAGPVLVTGATGGVGCMAIGMLAARGHEVVASTGKPDSADWLRSLGASDVIDRNELSTPSGRPLDKERWAGAVDCVGGETLATVLRSLRYGASVAVSGLTGGADIPGSTVLPFILRGVNVFGIDSVNMAIAPRRALWQRIATDLRPSWLDQEATQIIGLDDLSAQLDRILAGGMQGRVLVDPSR